MERVAQAAEAATVRRGPAAELSALTRERGLEMEVVAATGDLVEKEVPVGPEGRRASSACQTHSLRY